MYFVRNYSDFLHKYSEVDIFQIDNIHVVFWNQVLQQSFKILMGTNSAPLL